MQTHRLVCRGRMIGATVQSMRRMLWRTFQSLSLFQSAGFRTAAVTAKTLKRVAASTSGLIASISDVTRTATGRDDETKRSSKRGRRRRQIEGNQKERRTRTTWRQKNVECVCLCRRSWDVARTVENFCTSSCDPTTQFIPVGGGCCLNGHDGSDVQKLSSAVARRPLTPPTWLAC